MKLLLTSGGITNNSIRNALVDMMGKPIAEATALFVPTAEQPLRTLLCRAVGTKSPTTGVESVRRAGANCPAQLSRKKPGYRTSKPLTSCWWEAAIRCICATGCSSRGWRTSCRSCARRSMWE